MEENLPLKVEDYLNNISYKVDPYYNPSDFALKFINFIKLVNGEQGEEHKTPVTHYRMLDTVVSGNHRIINLCHRGLAKTTVMGEYLFLYLAVFGEIDGLGKVDLALYVSDSIENGIKNMRKNLEHRYENSDFLKHYIPEAKFTDIRWEFKNRDGKTLIVKGYGAQALSLDSKLYTLDGYITMKDCKVGDKIFGADGKLTTITKKSEVFYKPMYKITLEDGRFIKVSEDHLNAVVIKGNVHNNPTYTDKVLTTKELLDEPLIFSRLHKRKDKPNYISNERLVFIRNPLPLDYPKRNLPIDPYSLGVILGDGRIRKECGSVELTAHKDDMPHYHKEIPYEFGAVYADPRSNAITQSIRGLGKTLKSLGLNVRSEFKFIPSKYFISSIEQRQALIQGLMDTDGSCSENGRATFTSQSYDLCFGLVQLVRSLGGTAFMVRPKGRNLWKIEIWAEFPLFKLERKRVRNKPRTRLVAIKSIEPIQLEPSQCIAVDNEERQFVTDLYTRTHNTGVRGAKEMGKRPQLAVLDDLVSDEDARSATVISSIEDTIYKAVNYALHPTKNMIIWSGTPFNAKDPLYKAVESGAWAVNVFPVCEKFPCEREEFRGSWEDRFTYDYVKGQYDTAIKLGKIDTFNQELMLRIMSDEDRLIRDSDIRWFKLENILKNKGWFNFYITTDFATSEKQKADFSVISVWAYNNNGDWFWVDGVCARQTMDKNIDALFNFASMYKPMSVGIEVTGQQGGFIQWIMNEMMARNIYFPLASQNNDGNPGLRPNTNKLVRFNTVVPWFKAGKMYFPQERRDTPALKEGIEELTLAAVSGFKSKHDDFIDTISMLSLLPAFKPSEEIQIKEMKAEHESFWGIEEQEEDYSRIDSYII